METQNKNELFLDCEQSRPCHDDEQDLTLARRVTNRVANSEAVIVSQQRGEPELTHSAKVGVLDDLLRTKPSIFLFRFGKYLSEVELEYFDVFHGDYEIDYYLKQARKSLPIKNNKVTVNNRRYEYLRQLKTANSDYFSDSEMRRRCPLLFEELVGQYMTETERRTLHSSSVDGEICLSEFIFQRMDEEEIRFREAYEKELEDNAEEEDDDEDEGEDIDNGTGTHVTCVEKQRLHDEFVSIMEDRFIEGKDEEFDYSKVDGNQDFDPLDDQDMDEEEAYFDSEEPYMYSEPNGNSGDNHDQDF